MKNRLLPATRPVYDPPVLGKPNAADINPADGDRRLRKSNCAPAARFGRPQDN
jgi:hypothetical protein